LGPRRRPQRLHEQFDVRAGARGGEDARARVSLGTITCSRIEFLSEPLPPAGKFPATPPAPNGRAGPPYFIYPGNAGDGNYDNTWTFAPGNPNAVAYLGGASSGPGLGRRSIEEYYRTLIAAVSALDPNTPFIVGGRGGYNLDPELKEIISALSDAAGPNAVGGNLVAANKIIGTWDRLGSGTNQCTKTPNVCWTVAKLNCPMFMNQLGERNTGDGQKDPGDALTYGLRHATRAFQQWGIPCTVWDRRGNTSGGYGSEYSSGGADGDGANGNYTNVEPRRTDLANTFAERLAALETAAIAAANAAHGVLVYVKADFSNCTKVGGGTPALGDAISQINPVTDPDATGIVFTTHASGTVTLDYPWKDGASSTYLPSKRPVLFMDNVADAGHNSMLDGSIPFFGTTPSGNTATGDENFAAMVAALSTGGSSAGGMDLLTCGNTGTVVFYPQITMTPNGGTLTAKVIGDGPSGPTLPAVNTVTWSLQAGVPVVATLIKSGTKTNSAVTFLVNGIDDTGQVPVLVPPYAGSATGETLVGTADTLTAQTVAASGIASLSRLRIGGKSNTGSFVGTIAGFCLFRSAAPTLAQVRTIGRFLAALQGGGYKA
jgi:hypothetical protein